MTRHNLSDSRGMRSRDDDRFVDALDDAVCDASTSLARDDPERESTDAFVDARESWARSFPLHKCAWDNDVEGVRALLRAPGTDANGLDFAGHAALHVAALRRAVGATKALCECALVDPEARDARGWTPMRLALHRRARGCLRAIVRAKRRREREMMALERPKLAAALADIGDFETRVGWRFGSAVLAPLVKMVAPRDTYAVTCANGKLRVDGELRGIDSDALGRSVLPKWRRGKFSLIFNRGARGEPAELWFVDHESRDVVNAMERANETEGSRASMSAMSGDSATSEPMTEEEIVSATVEECVAEGRREYANGEYEKALATFARAETLEGSGPVRYRKSVVAPAGPSAGFKPRELSAGEEIAIRYNSACCHARLGNVEDGLAALKTALERGYDEYPAIRKDEEIASLREDPRFESIMARFEPQGRVGKFFDTFNGPKRGVGLLEGLKNIIDS